MSTLQALGNDSELVSDGSWQLGPLSTCEVMSAMYSGAIGILFMRMIGGSPSTVDLVD
jgi:hypothetical protein